MRLHAVLLLWTAITGQAIQGQLSKALSMSSRRSSWKTRDDDEEQSDFTALYEQLESAKKELSADAPEDMSSPRPYETEETLVAKYLPADTTEETSPEEVMSPDDVMRILSGEVLPAKATEEDALSPRPAGNLPVNSINLMLANKTQEASPLDAVLRTLRSVWRDATTALGLQSAGIAGMAETRLERNPWPWTEFRRNFSRASKCPPMFVVVMSRRQSTDQRDQVRAMWRQAKKKWGHLDVKFGICKQGGSNADDEAFNEDRLDDELTKFDDLLLMDCREGYTEGLLTQKTIAAMRSFADMESKHDLFMKTDDDTFVSPGRLCDYISSLRESKNEFKNAYMGVFAEDGETVNATHPPCRDTASPWYESEDKYGGDYFPMSAKGGPGYILSDMMVRNIMDLGIAERNMLNNEDKAVGVWVDGLRRYGMDIDYINLPGTDGYLEYHEKIKTRGRWDWYPYVLHHHLSSIEIFCLHQVDLLNDPNATIDDCFLEEHKKHDENQTFLENQNAVNMMRHKTVFPRTRPASLLSRDSDIIVMNITGTTEADADQHWVAEHAQQQMMCKFGLR